MNSIDVLCVGVTSYDLVFSIDHHPAADEKTVARSFTSCGGGPAANAAVTVARLGLRAAFCGYLGKDVFGQLNKREFEEAGVDIALVVQGKEMAPISTVLVKPNGDRSLVNYHASQPLAAESINFSNINPKVILFDGHEPDVSIELLSIARDKKIPTILDAGSLNKGTELLYDKVDYLVGSEIFASEISGGKKPDAVLSDLYNGKNNVVITLGKAGLVWKKRDGEGQLDVFRVDAADTTGAGDVFHGAFACCIAKKWDWDYTLKFSSAAAALSCTQLGARTSIPDKQNVENFLNIHSVI